MPQFINRGLTEAWFPVIDVQEKFEESEQELF